VSDDAAPVGLTWTTYVERLVDDAGGWIALAEELARRAAGLAEVPDDLQSIEKGLRRLARRAHQPGGQYGRWLLRLFGVPEDLERWARWLAQYHSRFADLPTSLRLEQLRLWDRPPFSESRLAAWVHVGLAAVHLRRRDVELGRQRLALARDTAARAGAAAIAEVALLDAYVAMNDGDRAGSAGWLDRAAASLADVADPVDAACLRARLIGQRAYALTSAASPDVAGARALFEALAPSPLPFVAFRRDNGLAYCAWQLGDRAAGVALARRAADHAGDGGFVRFRILALNLLARMLDEPEASEVRARSARLAASIEDEDLLAKSRR
jgi:hypothetical protein